MSKQIGSVKREVLIALSTMALSVLLLPGAIYIAGNRIFGPYSTSRIADIYLATLGDLLVPRMAAWLLLLTPAVCVVLLRQLLMSKPAQSPPAPPAAQTARREPSVSS